jgi:peptide chain release factor 2
MLELEDNLRLLNSLIEKLNSLEDALAISSLKKEVKSLQEQTSKDGFWDDQKSSQKIFARIKNLERKINSFENIKESLNNLIEMNELLLSEYDEELGKDLLSQTADLNQKIEKLELETLLSGKFDSNNAIITLHPGAGGTESQDWVQMLYRMYRKMG